MKSILPALLLFSLAWHCTAQETTEALRLTGNAAQTDLTPYLTILEDPAGEWTAQQAAAEFAARDKADFIHGTDNFGLSDSVYWIKVELESLFDRPTQWLLEMAYPALDRIDLFYAEAGGDTIQKSGGDTLPFDSRDLDHPNVVFSVDLPALANKELYFRVESQGSVQFPLTLWQADAFQDNAADFLLGRGFYYGIMLAMVLYNLFIFLSVRDRSYLFYILYVLCVTGYQFSNDGFALQYLWPETPAAGTYSITFMATLALFFGLLFCSSFLQVAEYSRRVNRVLQGLAGLTLFTAFTPFFVSYKLAALATPVLSIAVAGVIMGTGTWIAFKGYRPARFFMLAWVVFLSATIEVSMQRYGLLGSNFFTENGILIGTAMEVILLSLALADRINVLRREKELAQDKLLENNALTIRTLERADAMKNEFIANVSHELRTPLTGIIGLLDIVIPNVEGRIAERELQNLAMIRGSGWRLTSLVNDIVDISAINRDYLKLNRKAVDVHAVAEMVIAMCRPLLGGKPVRLYSTVPADLPLVYADEDRLQQIVFNLVSNAIKFTFEGEVEVGAERIEHQIRISVRDTGIGIAEDQQERIFEAFQQADSSTQREFGGSGLGLSITRKLLYLHGSQIDLDSKPGQGSRFSFSLPVSKAARVEAEEGKQLTSALLPPAAPIPVPSPTTPAREHAPTILLVDDESINLHVLQEYLQDRYRLLLAQDGFQALKILERNVPDLVLLDLMMPRMTGYELCRRIRANQSMADLPVIILTAKNQVEDLVAGLQAGANDYLSKPFFKEELLARVDKQIQLHDLIATRDENIRLQEQVRRYREAESKLHASRRRLARMLDISSDALLAVDEGGEIVYANFNAARMLGTDSRHVTGRPVDILVPAEAGKEHALAFPFQQAHISESSEPHYFSCDLARFNPGGGIAPDQALHLQVCILPLDIEQELFVIILSSDPVQQEQPPAQPELSDMPRLIEEVNRNTQRSQLISELLARISADKLRQEAGLLRQLESLDEIIAGIASRVEVDDTELRFRQALVALMQLCTELWQRVTQRSVIDLAEQSRIWRVSIDNGRLRARSMERYLDLNKLPKNPRWREVSRTAYYLLSNLGLGEQDTARLEQALARLQELLRAES